jgi:surface-anchored protein
MIVEMDAGLIPAAQVAVDPSFAMTGMETQSDGYFVCFARASRPVRTWDSRDGLSDPRRPSTSVDGSGISDMENAGYSLMTFSEPGLYYLTVASTVVTAAGETLTDSAAFTFVVGSEIDPATVTPAPQPDDDGPGGDDWARDDGVTVFHESDVRIAPVLQENGDLDLRVADHTAWQSQFVDADEAVFYLPDRDDMWPGEWADTPSAQGRWDLVVPRDTVPWRTSGYIDQSHAYYKNELMISLDGAHASTVETPTSVGLQSATGPGNVTTYTSGNTNFLPAGMPAWDSRPSATSTAIVLNDTGPNPSNYGGDVGFRHGSGWVFTEAGTYCVTLRAMQGDHLAAATFTVVVGSDIDPRDVPVCTQVAPVRPDGDDGDPSDPDPDDLDPTVTYLDIGHTDLAVDVVDGHTAIGVDDEKFYDLDDTIWVGQRPTNAFTVPTVTPTRDYSLIGEPGTPFWGFTESSSSATSLWPGLSLIGIRAGEILNNSLSSVTLLGVSGPGNVVIFGDSAATGERIASHVYWSSTQGYPQSRSFERGNHSHMNWAFTAQGVYCLNWQATLRLPDGVDSTATEQLTVVVGPDVNLAAVQPCGRDTQAPAPVGTVTTPATLDTAPVLLGASGQALIAPYLDDGALQVFARVQDSPTGPLVNRDVEAVIFSTNYIRQAGYYGGDGGWWAGWDESSSRVADISWDTAWLDRAGLAGDPTLALGAVEGPGDVSVMRGEWIGTPTIAIADALALSTAADGPRETLLRAGWRERHVVHSFSAAGVYCVPLTWAVELSDGATAAVTKTLTFVAGSTTAGAADYVDRSGIVPCAAGGYATQPGGGDGGDGPGSGDGGGQGTDYDAVVLDIGHAISPARSRTATW